MDPRRMRSHLDRGGVLDVLLVAAVLLSRCLGRRWGVAIGAALLAGLGAFQLVQPRDRTPLLRSPRAAPSGTRAGAIASPAYSVTDLGTLPQLSESRASDINDRGQIVGWSGVRN